MPESGRFRILTPDDLISYDTFVIADEQSLSIEAGCLVLIHEASGRRVAVHRTRLVPVTGASVQVPKRQHRHVCEKCGKVEGVAEDQVVCPFRGRSNCGLVEAKLR